MWRIRRTLFWREKHQHHAHCACQVWLVSTPNEWAISFNSWLGLVGHSNGDSSNWSRLLVWKHANGHSPGVKAASDQFMSVIVPPFKFIPTENRWNLSISWKTQHHIEQCHTGTDGQDHKSQDIRTQGVVHVHVVPRWQAIVVAIKHTLVNPILVSADGSADILVRRWIRHLWVRKE